MNYNAVAATGEKIIQKIAKKADDCIGKTLAKTGKVIVKNIHIPQDLGTILYDAGIDITKKNTRRTVEAALKHQVLAKLDKGIELGCKIATAGPEPGMTDVVVEGVEMLKNYKIMKNLGFANAADNARNILSFKHENAPTIGQNIIANYLNSPANMAKIYIV